jgi:hypothetical protein
MGSYLKPAGTLVKLVRPPWTRLGNNGMNHAKKETIGNDRGMTNTSLLMKNVIDIACKIPIGSSPDVLTWTKGLKGWRLWPYNGFNLY